MNLLKPNFRNIILPVILIIMYLIVANYMYSYAKIGDEYICDIIHLGEKAKEYYEQNNSLANQTIDEYKQLSVEWGEKIPKSAETFVYLGSFLENINPLFPTPCSMASSEEYCRYYISEETNTCFTSIYEESDLFNIKLKPYKKVNIFHHLTAMIILFIEGYVFSILLFILYNIIKNKIKKTKKKPNNFGF